MEKKSNKKDENQSNNFSNFFNVFSMLSSINSIFQFQFSTTHKRKAKLSKKNKLDFKTCCLLI